MKYRYTTRPPTIVENLPRFLFKKYVRGTIDRLIAWAQKEYYDAIVELYSEGELEIAKHLEDNCSYVDFVAHSKTFARIVENMDEGIWAMLDKKTRNVLIGANNILVSGTF